MWRKAARPANAGVIVGQGRTDPLWNDRQPGSMNEAMAALTGIHHLRVTAKWHTFTYFGPLARDEHSRQFRSGRRGAAVRIIRGSGSLIVGELRYTLGYAQWAFVPSGMVYELTSAPEADAGLEFSVMRVGRRWRR